MLNGPVMKAAFALAIILMVMSLALFAFPQHVMVLGSIAGVVAVAVVVILVVMLLRMRKD